MHSSSAKARLESKCPGSVVAQQEETEDVMLRHEPQHGSLLPPSKAFPARPNTLLKSKPRP